MALESTKWFESGEEVYKTEDENRCRDEAYNRILKTERAVQENCCKNGAYGQHDNEDPGNLEQHTTQIPAFDEHEEQIHEKKPHNGKVEIGIDLTVEYGDPVKQVHERTYYPDNGHHKAKGCDKPLEYGKCSSDMLFSILYIHIFNKDLEARAIPHSKVDKIKLAVNLYSFP